jgi:hypothetical protein
MGKSSDGRGGVVANQESNGAREALLDILEDAPLKMFMAWDKERATDLMLIKLAERGFVIVPLEDRA